MLIYERQAKAFTVSELGEGAYACRRKGETRKLVTVAVSSLIQTSTAPILVHIVFLPSAFELPLIAFLQLMKDEAQDKA